MPKAESIFLFLVLLRGGNGWFILMAIYFLPTLRSKSISHLTYFIGYTRETTIIFGLNLT